VPATDKRVRFIGVEPYREAGGILRRDLFGDEDSVYLQDAGLLEHLVREKLESAAAQIRAEGWSWVETAPEFGYPDSAKFEQVRPSRVKLPKKERAALGKLCKQYDKLAEQAGEDFDAVARLDELQAQIDAIEAKAERWSAETLALAGAIVTIGHHGELDIRRGLIRPEDVRKAKAAAKTKKAGGETSGEATQPPASGAFSAALLTD
jgi:ParB family chromosome partitioning protein